jgi:hypothetical protein
VPLSIHTATLSYLAEFADIASEYSIGLRAAQSAAYGLQRIRWFVLAISFQQLTLFSAIDVTYLYVTK